MFCFNKKVDVFMDKTINRQKNVIFADTNILGWVAKF